MPHFDHFPRPGEIDPYANVIHFFLYLSATLNVGVWRHLCLGLDFEEGRIIVVENGEHIADIRHYRYFQRWCTFFKPVYFLAERLRNIGLF